MWHSLMLLALVAPPGVIPSAVGVTRDLNSIECWLAPDDLDYSTRKTRALVIGAPEAVRWFYTSPDARAFREKFAVSAVTVANTARGYPPSGDAYGGSEEMYLWRWIGMHAPDLVVEVRDGTATEWYVPDSELGRFSNALKPVRTDAASDEL